jgi:hypothetical protein
LVHKPSGISRFLDLAEASFGFFGKLEFGVGAGGVTAGSPDSSFSVFLLKEVAMLKASESTCAAMRQGAGGRPAGKRRT